jgi:glycerol-3-phosphate dehydrogenase
MDFSKEFDVVIVGGGIVGTTIARELSKYQLNVALLEKDTDVALGTTKANSAILHAGYDARLGSIKADTNVRGNKLYHELEKDLNLDIKWCGSLVVAISDDDMKILEDLLARGKKNNVPDLKIISREEVLAMEPNLGEDVKGALFAKTAGVCWPFGAAVAFAESAVRNGVELMRNCAVEDLILEAGRVQYVKTSKGVFKTKYVVNAAGVFAEEIAKMAGDNSFTITPRKGEYILFDKSASKDMVRGVVFPTPTKISKGTLICTTTHGNTFIGPNAHNILDKEDTSVTGVGMEEILASARKILPNIPMGKVITEFGGLRAASDTGEFIVGESKVPGLVLAAGMQSPGLTAAPAVAEDIAKIITSKLDAKLKENFIPNIPKRRRFISLSNAKKKEAIKENKLYGRVVCRCETITEAEILEAIHEPVGALTVDAVKRRTRAGMGRCQGGFCGPRVTEILARELNISIPEVLKECENSNLFFEKNETSEEVTK